MGQHGATESERVPMGGAFTYTCECPAPERRPYLVTGHDRRLVVCSYCNDCAAEAAGDWNGETAAIAPIAAAPVFIHIVAHSVQP